MLSDFKQIIGTKYTTNEGYQITICDYVDKSNVMFFFDDKPEITYWNTIQNIKNGQIKNPFHKSVYNIGYYGIGKYSARKNNTKTPEYIKWFSMFVRCYDDKYHKKQPTYIGCTVSNEFQCFQNFAEWYNRNIYTSSWFDIELDKDLLFENNKIYSPKTCCFLPKEINSGINSNRNNKSYMKYLYEKYKNDIPYYLKMEIYKLTV